MREVEMKSRGRRKWRQNYIRGDVHPNLVLLFGRKYKDKKVRREERGHDQDWIKLGNQLVIYAVVLVFLNKQVTS